MTIRYAVPQLTPDPGQGSGAARAGTPIRRRWLGPRYRTGAGADVLILQHQGTAPAGLLLDVLRSRHLTWRIIRVDRSELLPDPRSVAVAFVLGCDQSLHDPEHRWIAAEIDWLRGADHAGTGILGVGFGAQALAIALGGAVEPTERTKRGWLRVSTADPRRVAPGPWFSWDDTVLHIPPGAELLADNENGPQAYGMAHHLGVQFHPEVTPKIINDWVEQSSDPALDTQRILEATSREFEAAALAAHGLFTTFTSAAQRVLP